MSDCIFCKIIEGEIPSFTIYEDEIFKVILDRFPASKGHMLILPKSHHVNIWDMSEEVSTKIYGLAKKMANTLSEAFQVDGINIVQNNGAAAGQSVFHFHLHLIPRYKGDDIVLNTTMQQDMTLAELEKVAEELKSYVK
ncbi:MAG: HIT family protein [Cellulosilyticaceae bacterium]